MNLSKSSLNVSSMADVGATLYCHLSKQGPRLWNVEEQFAKCGPFGPAVLETRTAQVQSHALKSYIKD